jgi:hypothetical protein
MEDPIMEADHFEQQFEGIASPAIDTLAVNTVETPTHAARESRFIGGLLDV